MSTLTESQKIVEFNSSSKQFHIAYGGDGTLLEAVRRYGADKSIIPIRNYGRCEEHGLIVDDVLGATKDLKTFKYGVPATMHPKLRVDLPAGKQEWTLSEFTLKNQDTTSCCRFDVKVNGKVFMENVIADGVITATPMGSHGYFKSVARTLFNEGIGVGFIAPTYGINNLVLKQSDKVSVVVRRAFTAVMTFDKISLTSVLDTGAELTVGDACENVYLFGYEAFCCSQCRLGRNSTVLVNDQYLG